jgi:hypothetical protein
MEGEMEQERYFIIQYSDYDESWNMMTDLYDEYKDVMSEYRDRTERLGIEKIRICKTILGNPR